MALILRKEGNANVTTPPAGSGSIFLSEDDAITVKSSTGNISSILTFTADTNTQVFFNDAGELGQSNVFTFDSNTGNLSVSGILTDNYYYANGQPLDFEQPAGSNTQIQFNDDSDFGASANLTFDTATNELGVTGNIVTSGILTDNYYYSNGAPLDFEQPAGANNQIQYNNDGSFGASSTFTFDPSTNQLDVSGNVVANRVVANFVLTDNYYYANGEPVDFEQPAGNTTEIQFNNNGDFGSSANLKFNDGNSILTVLGTVVANVLDGQLETPNQPNITSVGNLVNLTVDGNVDANNVSVTNDITVDGNALIGGNLTVNGNVTYVNVEHFNVEDPIISLGGGPNGSPLASDDGKDRGLLLHYYDTTAIDAFMGWEQSNAEFVMAQSVTVSDETVTVGSLGNLRVDTLLGNVSGETATLTGELSGNTANFSGDVVLPNLTVNASLSGATANFSGNVVLPNLSVNSELSGNTANFSGNVVLPNLTVNNEFSGNTANYSGNVVLPNLTVNSELSGNTANFSGELTGNTANFSGSLTAVDANLGNTVDANYFTGVLTFAAQPNITSVGTLTGLLIGATSDANDFPNAVVISSQDNTGDTSNALIGLAGEASADEGTSSDPAIGLYGVGKTNGNIKATGVEGRGLVTSTTDLAPAVGLRGYSLDSHADGYNIGVLGNAMNSGVGNYAFYVQNGGIGSIETETFWDLVDNSNAALTFHSDLKANIFGIETTNNAEGIFTTGYLNVSGNATVGGVVTDNYYYANGAPLDFQRPAGSNNQIQFNDNEDFGASANLTFDPATDELGVIGTLSVSGNANVGNIGADEGVFTTVTGTLATAAQPNVTSLGTLTSLDVTGNITADDVTSNTLGGTLTTAAQPNVTSLGTLSSLSVTGNVSAGNVSGTLLTGTLATAAQPNVTSLGTLSSLDVTANVTAGNVYANSGTIGASALTGTLTTAAQPNVTSVGTLTSLDVTGNASAGNISTTGALSVTGNVSAGNVSATDVSGTTLGGTLTTAAQPNVTSVGTLTSLTVTGAVSAGNINGNNANFTGEGKFSGNLNMSNVHIINLAEPVNGTDAATKTYVDEVAEGLKSRPQVEIATTTNLTANYDNGNAGVGATLTSTTNGAFPEIDGVTLTSTTPGENGVLVKDQTTAAENGRYNLTQVGDGSNPWILTRCGLCDESDEIAGSYTFVKSGTLYAGTGWVQTVTDPSTFVIGTDPIIVVQFSGAGTYTAGTGLTLTGTEFSVNAAQPGITSVGTLDDLDVTGDIISDGNITSNGGLFIGNGAGFTDLVGANVTGQVGNALVAGTVYTNAQPNITSVGTLTSLAVTGNASAGNISTGGTLSVTGNANVGNIGAAAGIFTTVSGDGSSLSALNASNISTGTLDQARLANSSLTVNGVEISLGGSNTITANTTETLTRGTYLTGSNFDGGTATTWAVDATSANTANKVVARDASGDFSAGTITATLSGAATTSGTVTTAAQPNITSVGTLTSLAISGTNNLTVRTITTGANTTTGTITGNWSLSAGSRLNATYADLAECYVADQPYEPGTVVIFGGEQEVTAHGVSNDTAVAGVVSTEPAYVMNSACEGEHVVQLALIGRVPCKAIGPVAKGDLMVTAEIPGFAMANNIARAGTIVGKALDSLADGEEGVVEVLVGRT